MFSSALNRLFIKWNLPFGVHQVSGSPIARTWGRSSIDHSITNHAAMARLVPTRVYRVSDMSDHWPIRVWLRNSIETTDTFILEASEDNIKRKIPIKQLQNDAHKFLNHNYWDALLEAPVDSPAQLNSLASAFIDVTQDVSKTVSPAPLATSDRKPKIVYPRALDRLLTEKRLRYHQYINHHGTKQSKGRRYGVYAVAASAARKALKAYQAERWQESIRSGVERFAFGESRQGWKWLKGIGQLNPPRVTSTPLRSPSGELLMDPEQITNRWKEQYSALASDCTGNSLSPSKWQTPLYASISHPELPINHGPTWSDFYDVISTLKKNKASGSDRISCRSLSADHV